MRILKSKRLVAATSAIGVTGVVIGGLLLSAGQSSAETVTVDKTLNYTCPFPLIGDQKLKVQIQTVVETPANEGGELKAGEFTATVTVPETATQGLVLVSAATVEGTGSAGIILNNEGKDLPIAIPNLAVEKTNVPASGTFTVKAKGQVPTAFPKAGPTSVTIGDFSTTLTPKTAAGAETGLGTFESKCKMDPGQDAKILDFVVGPPTGGGTSTTVPPTSTTAPTSGTTEPTTSTTAPTSGTTEPTTTTGPTTTTTGPTTTTQPGGGGGQPIPVDKTLNFTCPFPLIGTQQLKVQIKATLTPPTAPGGNLTTSDFSAIATVPETATQGLSLVSAKTIEGSAIAKVSADNAGTPIEVTIPNLGIPKTDVPGSGTFTVTASGDVAPQAVPNAGETVVSVAGFTTTLTPRTAAGAETGLGTFDAVCTLVPGQDTVIGRFTVGGGGGTTTTNPPTSTTPPTTSTTVPTSGSTTPPTSGSTTPPTSGSTTPPTSSTTKPPTTSTTVPTSGSTTAPTTAPTTVPTTTTAEVTTTLPPVLTQDPTDYYPAPGGGGSYPGYPSSGSGGLASTGASIGLPIAIGGALVLAGAGALFWQRRRAARNQG